MPDANDATATAPTPERPTFTAEQIEWLKGMLTPRCCHVTGEHDPRHFLDRRYVCEIQMAERYRALRGALELGDADPRDAVEADDGCSRCEYEREQAARKKDRQGAG